MKYILFAVIFVPVFVIVKSTIQQLRERMKK